MVILKFYQKQSLDSNLLKKKLENVKEKGVQINGVELCYYIECDSSLNKIKINIIKWILSKPFEPDQLLDSSAFEDNENVIEIGPKLNFSTAFSSNAVSIFQSIRMKSIVRIERSTRYLIGSDPSNKFCKEMIADLLLDKMTECRYTNPIETFDHGYRPEKWYEIDINKLGKKALEDANLKLGLSFDNWDLDFYTYIFSNKLKRNPTSVECFDLAQSNSEHSRHWFFKGRIIIDGKEEKKTLMDIIIDTQNTSNQNNVIKFSDNSSAIEGFEVKVLRPSSTDRPSAFYTLDSTQHLIFTAETHNFPTGIAPFSGATTGAGGRLRDIQSVGRGGYYIAGTAGYSVGNLFIPGYTLDWEGSQDEVLENNYGNMAKPLDILIEASNGASDYGNKFGEPLILGFVRSFGMKQICNINNANKMELREWIKPIMFSGGIGSMEANMTKKLPPEPGMRVVKIGGPAYRIGVGGGAASSVMIQGDNESEMDFAAVQRGDPEMEQKLNRMIRACMEMGDKNLIVSIHDQGAGGNGNVLKELVDPAGAVIFSNSFELGDPSISSLELWGAEYQENNAILCKEEDIIKLKRIGIREKCPVNCVGTVTGTGKIIFSEEECYDINNYMNKDYVSERRHPVDLELELVLGKMPRKTFHLERHDIVLHPLATPNITILQALNLVLRLPSVASKRYLTSKVDRCVTGLVAQQQCVGPLHTPLADVAVVGISHFNTVGIATSIGEQPIKGLLSPAAGARMTVAEALSNLVFARISNLEDVKCSGNWMWPAKMPGEGAALYDACTAMCSIMKEFGIAVDGGKDSLSMVARNGRGEAVKAPGTLVVSCYAPCPDIRQVVTPDLKGPFLKEESTLIFVDLSAGKSRLGGTAFNQVHKQLGDTIIDVEDSSMIKNAFKATQNLIKNGKILAGHDVSDGGLITCILEMSFAGISGIIVNINHKSGSPIEILFAEEIGWVLEVRKNDVEDVLSVFHDYGAPIAHIIGNPTEFGTESKINVLVNDACVLENVTVGSLMTLWEETSFRLDLCQTNMKCAKEEYENLQNRTSPTYKLTFNPDVPHLLISNLSIPVAILREEGTNGDREMAASLYEAGFEVWDITMQDLLSYQITLNKFQGIIFPGGFSYADVFGSAKGWAASLLFNPLLQKQLQKFIVRPNTFSFGVCNGCQLMSLLGWIGNSIDGKPNIILAENDSERFECRWSTVVIEKSPAIMLQGMEGNVFGVWVAHKEGKFTFRNDKVLAKLKEQNCIPIKYVDDKGAPTTSYPLNPNGSIDGIAAICSSDGRHLAMMPHPERCTQTWQMPWVPANWKYKSSPWIKLFQNAYVWCSSRQ
ncbi:PREDICTED: phosphoribosylformylglycinamidine synthase [Ceratosolen solmsi marchali]|uniref:Phosphoribosylformylglycinamidine synthase n=1 Tax=Ceratosolen solmsi marchali TaxID=326594 RepID=A0AAJ6YMH4_9HYME|nr:PREDICTED: phosphoribosylformylglycinamidine synthase [Ceratosolen solmsi marchali]